MNEPNYESNGPIPFKNCFKIIERHTGTDTAECAIVPLPYPLNVVQPVSVRVQNLAGQY